VPSPPPAASLVAAGLVCLPAAAVLHLRSIDKALSNPG
jgi:hypothetical protein